jgi:hypothetical protein
MRDRRDPRIEIKRCARGRNLSHMPRCIICLEEKDRLTDEHVFPAAIGGVLEFKNSVCAECNHEASKFEQPLVGELRPTRLLFKVPDRRGDIPAANATFRTGERELRAKVDGDGNITLAPAATRISREDGKKETLHEFVTPALREKLERKAAKKGQVFTVEQRTEPLHGEVHVGGDLNLVGQSEGLRTASKIAYVGVGYLAGSPTVINGPFEAIRQYIRCGTGTAPSRIFVNRRFSSLVLSGPHQHSLIIAARRASRRVDAIVRLFGDLNYFVTLSNHYDGVDFFQTLVYDASRGERCGILHPPLIDAEAAQVEDVLTSQDTVWDDLVEFGKHWVAFVEAAVRAKELRDNRMRVDRNGTP